MVILLVAISGYSIGGYWWLLIGIILVAILMVIGGYFVIGYWWLLMVIILVVTSGYPINDYYINGY